MKNRKIISLILLFLGLSLVVSPSLGEAVRVYENVNPPGVIKEGYFIEHIDHKIILETMVDGKKTKEKKTFPMKEVPRILVDGKSVDISKLEGNWEVELKLENSKVVSITKVKANTKDKKTSKDPNLISGKFKGYINPRVKIETYKGKENTITFSTYPDLLIDGRPIKFSDFRAGMEVYIELEGGTGTYMDAFSTSSPGYLPPGTKSLVGTVKMIDRDQIKIGLPVGGEETYFLSPGTLIKRNGENVTANALYVGDNVKLVFDDEKSSLISMMEIEGESIGIKNLYKGDLDLVDGFSDNFTLANLESMVNGRWNKANDGLRISFNPETPIYIGGMEIPRKNLKHYRGKTAYLAIKNELGRDWAEKVVLKNNYENSYSTKIENINWYSSQIELANKQNVNINEGTIVVKNGRLVDIHSLNPKTDGLIITDGRGLDQTAGVIYVFNEDLNNSNIGQDQIYSGRLDKIFEYRLVLRDFFLLNKNDWESFRKDKDLYFDNETFIYDLEEKREISPKEFQSAKYAVDEKNKDDKDSRDWYGYIYTDGDRISSIFVKKKMDSLLKQRTTVGLVESQPVETSLMGWKVVIRDGKDWSSSHEEWKAKNSNLNIYLNEAMIMKDGKRIKPTDIKPGDRLYLTRDSNIAKVIVVK